MLTIRDYSVFKMIQRCLFLIVLLSENTYEDPFVSDISSLSELPLDKLLKVKNTINLENLVENELTKSDDKENGGFEKFTPQALHNKNRKTFLKDHGWLKKPGKKGVSTLFHISVTSLAFLAFGGYLLCLLVQAIKSKNYTTMALMTTPLKQKRRKRGNEPVWPDADPEDLYRALKLLSEGYANYYQSELL